MDSELTISCIKSTHLAFEVTTAVPLTIPSGAEETISVQFQPIHVREYHEKLYIRQVSEDELVARVVTLRGFGAAGEDLVSEGKETADGKLIDQPSFTLFANWPNPVRNSTVFQFAIPQAGKVSLQILDVRGRRADTLVDGVLPAGTHTVSWDAEDRPSGLYFYRLRFGNRVETRKLILMR
jgi:hypothetical protein